MMRLSPKWYMKPGHLNVIAHNDVILRVVVEKFIRPPYNNLPSLSGVAESVRFRLCGSLFEKHPHVVNA
jgi:hypothetical protein